MITIISNIYMDAKELKDNKKIVQSEKKSTYVFHTLNCKLYLHQIVNKDETFCIRKHDKHLILGKHLIFSMSSMIIIKFLLLMDDS